MSVGLEAREPNAKYLVASFTSLIRDFELFATAPDAVTKLRELILVLAVQGKLVLQAAKDEPGDRLLERILAEKARMVSVGKIKLDKPQIVSNDFARPHSIPSTWIWTRLGTITTYAACDKAGSISDGTWVLDLEDIEKDTGRILRRVNFAERRSLSDKNAFRTGDVLYGNCARTSIKL